jgi:hypothetical protein
MRERQVREKRKETKRRQEDEGKKVHFHLHPQDIRPFDLTDACELYRVVTRQI